MTGYATLPKRVAKALQTARKPRSISGGRRQREQAAERSRRAFRAKANFIVINEDLSGKDEADMSATSVVATVSDWTKHMDSKQLFAERRSESSARLAAVQRKLKVEIQRIRPVLKDPDVCIYATGSLARLEANPSSDLDAFFFLTGSGKIKPLGRIHDIKVLNAVLLSAEESKFPDFSNDGEYLKFLHIDDVLSHIGGREDDYHNALTARMLLMLESKFLYNEPLFEKFRADVIERYFIDFHHHATDFRPIFLLNDILRFWRTMCLNYEHNREWRSDDHEKRAKGHLANLKLRFSRLSICFTFIAQLLSCGKTVTSSQVSKIAKKTPLERLDELPNLSSEDLSHVDILKEEYAWFLDAVGYEKQVVLSWIADQKNRDNAFAHGKIFVDTMYKLIFSISERHDYTRYLVV